MDMMNHPHPGMILREDVLKGAGHDHRRGS